MTRFAEIVDAADKLSVDEQQALVDLLMRRIADERRKRLVQDVQEARAEFAKGECGPASVEQIIDEVRP